MKKDKGKEVTVEERQAREIRRLKASIRRLRTQRTGLEQEADLVANILNIVGDSLELFPEIKMPEFVAHKESVHPEIAVLVFSDSHIGKKTTTYRPSVFVKRLRKLEQSMMGIVTAMRSIRPIKKLVILFNGDIVDSESIFPGQTSEISLGVVDQIFTIGLPELTKFILFCLANFEEVEIHATKGNHGRLYQSKWTNYPTTNWDVVLYKALQATTHNQPRLKWNVYADDWKALVRIYNEGFLVTHGDMIRMYYNTPAYGQSRQAMRWSNAFRDKIKLSHFIYSHFHSLNLGTRFNNITYYCNGSWVTTDQFGLEKIGVASTAEQLLFGVHPKHGVTWRYPLKLGGV